MISIYELKPKFQSFLRPLVQRLARAGVTANQVTLAAMLLSILTGALILFNPQQILLLFFVPLVLFVRMALNAIDGMLAREHNMKSVRAVKEAKI
jgi:CDP-diacylglycerol--glycerol-3-phosphate 3-phosphatidyltransferase